MPYYPWICVYLTVLTHFLLKYLLVLKIIIITVLFFFFLPLVCQCKIMQYHARDAWSSFEQTGMHILAPELYGTVLMYLKY